MIKILQLTDLHFGIIETDEHDIKTYALIQRLVNEQQPDLIVVTGDLIWSLVDGSIDVFDEVLSFLDDFDIPLAITFGNHDSESDFARDVLNAKVMDLKNFVIPEAMSNDNGRMSYYFTMEDNGAQHRMYLMDSGDYDEYKVGEYGFILPSQIDWIVESEANFKGISYLFIHIPLPEYRDAKRLGLAEGNQDEDICAPMLNTGMFSRLMMNTNVKSVYCGHDHDNDFSAMYHGVLLNYGRVTGYNTYGKLQRGGRVIAIEGIDFETYIVE